MRIELQRMLAGRYADAVLNVVRIPFSVAECHALQRAITHYTNNPQLLFFLQVPLYTLDKKQEALALVRATCELPTIIDTLDALLLMHHRIFLLPLVYAALIEKSHARAQRIPCTVTSSCSLATPEQHIIRDFIKQVLHGTPLITWRTNPALIAGVTLQTRDLRWEDSIDAQLRTLTQSVLI